MLIKIVASGVIIIFFLILNVVGKGLLEPNNLLSKVFPLASTILALFFIGLLFFG